MLNETVGSSIVDFWFLTFLNQSVLTMSGRTPPDWSAGGGVALGPPTAQLPYHQNPFIKTQIKENLLIERNFYFSSRGRNFMTVSWRQFNDLISFLKFCQKNLFTMKKDRSSNFDVFWGKLLTLIELFWNESLKLFLGKVYDFYFRIK